MGEQQLTNPLTGGGGGSYPLGGQQQHKGGGRQRQQQQHKGKGNAPYLKVRRRARFDMFRNL